jgi:hypothetical protein
VANGAHSSQVYNGARGFASGTAFWDAGWQVYPVNLNTDVFTDFFLYDPVRGLWVQADPVNGLWAEAFSSSLGDFTFPAAGQFDPGWTVGVTDFNADGRADLLMSNAGGVFVQLTNIGDGVFGGAAGSWGTGWKVFTRRSTDR